MTVAYLPSKTSYFGEASLGYQLVGFILACLEFIVRHIHFTFHNSHYLQVQGLAMGTCFVPSYANLYLVEWERLLFSDEATSMYMRHALAWHRYIDDILLLWDDPVTFLEPFLNYINQHNTF